MQSGDLNLDKARKEMIEVGKLLYQRGYICGLEGNLSIKLEKNRFLTTPSGTCKGRIAEEDLILVKANGDPVDKNALKPSTELKMHLTVYEEREDVFAIVHAHPTAAVGFTVAGVSLDKCVLPEVVCTLGRIPTAPYATPSTDEVPESIKEIVRTSDALVLDHHGALTMAQNIWDAYYKMETLEHYAQTMLVAQLLGGAKPLESAQVEKLLDICSVYGLKKPRNLEKAVSSKHGAPDGE